MSRAGVTLLLNASYEPLSVISWQRAVSMHYLEKVEVLSVYDDRDVRTVSFSIKMPSVVRLLRYVRRRVMRIKFSRQNIYSRDGYLCQYCSKSPPEVELSLDHVIPRSQGGRTAWDNIVACCVECNRYKGGRTPDEAKMPLLQTPFKPRTMAQLSVSTKVRKPPESWVDYL